MTPVEPGGHETSAAIRKESGAWAVTPNLVDYEAARSSFTWEEARRSVLDGLPGGGGLNIAHEAVDRHAHGPRAERTAIRWLARDGRVQDLTYADLAQGSSRFANVLRGLGVQPGERVFSLLGRVPELHVVALGTLKARCVFSPLFSVFGPEPIRSRLEKGGARVLVTTPTLWRKKAAAIRDDIPSLEHILLVGGEETETGAPERGAAAGVRSLHPLMADAVNEFVIEPTDPEEPALLHFTSGTTGTPKGAVHVHEAVLAHHVTASMALDLHPDDVFWCTADPGWVTGTSYGIVAPLSHGLTSVVDEGDLDAERWYGILQDQRVTVWYTAPTAIRMLMKVGAELPGRFDLTALRFIASVGEPLNPEAVTWGLEAFGMPIHDNWWQTETGGIMIANLAALDVHPGSMGLPLPGVEAGVVRRRDDGGVEEVTDPDEQGELALRPGWPSMFRTYLGEEERYRRCFEHDWYLTGDLVRRDEDGRFWFVSRADDVIKSAGHLVGPFEVESALMEHPSVAEAAVIGMPDPVVGELVKAFVTLKPGNEVDDELRLDLLGFARKRLGPAVAPREIDVVDSIPKTRSGKVMRRLLRARELGLPEGDVSTLEPT